MSTLLSPTKSSAASTPAATQTSVAAVGEGEGKTTNDTVLVTNRSLFDCDKDATDAYYGEKLASSLELLLGKIKQQGLQVSPKDRDRLSRRCFAPGNPEPEFADPNVASTESFQYLSSLAEGLRADPRGRSHVVDHYPSPYTEDSFWLSLPKWQSLLGNDDINWSIVTVRSIDRSTFRECFDDWDVKHVHGTALVTQDAGNSKSATGAARARALFSDQPRMVDHHGRVMGIEPGVEFVIRVFRCAPRECLREGIASVLSQDCPPTVFDLWIRHHEVPDHVEGFGRFKHDLGSDVTLLELLTDVDHSPSLLGLLPSTPPQQLPSDVACSPPPRPQGRPQAPLPGQKYQPWPLGLDSALQDSEDPDDASYNADLDTSLEDNANRDENKEIRFLAETPSPAPPIPCVRILMHAATVAIPRPLPRWAPLSPISPALATAASTSAHTALQSPPHDTDSWFADEVFGDGNWPDLRPLPDPILVRALSEDMDLAATLERMKALRGATTIATRSKDEGSSFGIHYHDGNYYSCSAHEFPEDYVGDHHRRNCGTNLLSGNPADASAEYLAGNLNPGRKESRAKSNMALRQRRKKQDKRGAGGDRSHKTSMAGSEATISRAATEVMGSSKFLADDPSHDPGNEENRCPRSMHDGRASACEMCTSSATNHSRGGKGVLQTVMATAATISRPTFLRKLDQVGCIVPRSTPVRDSTGNCHPLPPATSYGYSH
jgi:hypothetical protein